MTDVCAPAPSRLSHGLVPVVLGLHSPFAAFPSLVVGEALGTHQLR